MKIGWIAAVAVVVGLVLLLILRGGQNAQPASSGSAELARTGARSGGAGERAGAPGGRAGFGIGRHDSNDDGPASGSGAAGGRGERLAGAGAASGAAAASGGRGGFGGAALPRAGEADVTRREAPAAGSAGAVAAYDAGGVDAAGEPIPDVVYEGGAEKVFPSDSQEEVTDAAQISGAAGTISFWIKPEWSPGSQDDATLVQLGDSGMEVTKNVNFLRFQFHDSAGGENGLGTNLATWAPNEWRQVTATWAQNQLNLYVDGQLVSQNSFAKPPEFQGETKLYVGSAYASGAPAARASISSLLVLNRDYSAGEIGAQFHNGPPGSQRK